MRWILLSIVALIVVGCGYKPSSQAIKEHLLDTVFVVVKVDRAEPENAPFVKDELHRMVYTRFKGRIAPKALAQSRLYVVRYRVNIKVSFDLRTKQGQIKKRISTVYESDIQASSLYSSTLRTEAIRKGLSKALDEFFAFVSAKFLTP